MVNNSQKKVGYRDVVFNIKDNNLYEKTEGDNYKKLGTVGGSGDGSGDGGGTIQTTATLPLANPTRGSRADSTNLKTQADFNNYINESVREETTNRANADVELQVQITKLENKVDGIDGVDLEIPAWTQDEDTWVFPSEDVQFPQNVFCDGKFYGDGSKLTNLPEPVLEGALVFKGSVDTEASLPDSDNTVGDLWHTNDDDSLYAWGEDDAWHNVGSSTDINLDEYARLDGATFSSVGVGNDPSFYQGWYFTQNQLTLKKGGRQHILISPTYSKYYKTGITSPSIEFDHEEGTITANEFIGDGSKLENLPAGANVKNWVKAQGYITSDDLTEGVAKLDDPDQDIKAKTFTGELISTQNAMFLNVASHVSTINETGIVWANIAGTKSFGFTPDEGLKVVGADSNMGTGTVSAGAFVGDGSGLTNLPAPVLEGALIFKGSVENQSALPDSDNEVGDLWHTNADDGLYAWGEDDAWHNVGSTEVNLDEYAKLEDPEQEIEAKRFLAGDDIRTDNTNPNTIGVEVHGDLGIVHVKPKNVSVSPLEVFAPGSIVSNANSSIFRVTPHGEVHINHDAIVLKEDGTVTAKEFVGDGSKLTNLPIPEGGSGGDYMPYDITTLPEL